MLSSRMATPGDVTLYYQWVTDPEVRSQSFHSDDIDFNEHEAWFNKKLLDPAAHLLVFELEGKPVGQVRFQQEDENGYVIGISVDANFRNQGLAAKMLLASAEQFFTWHASKWIYAYIKASNAGSIKSFLKAGYKYAKDTEVDGIKSGLYIKTNIDENK